MLYIIVHIDGTDISISLNVPGSVLQTSLLLIDSVSQYSFLKISSKHLPSQTLRARELTFSEKVHLPSPVMCHAKQVMCQIWRVTCQMSHV